MSINNIDQTTYVVGNLLNYVVKVVGNFDHPGDCVMDDYLDAVLEPTNAHGDMIRVVIFVLYHI